jgi:hypothetical protein
MSERTNDANVRKWSTVSLILMPKRVLLIVSLLARFCDSGERCTPEALVFHKEKEVPGVNEIPGLRCHWEDLVSTFAKKQPVKSYRTLIKVGRKVASSFVLAQTAFGRILAEEQEGNVLRFFLPLVGRIRRECSDVLYSVSWENDKGMF